MGLRKLSDVSNDVLDAIVRRAGTAMRENNRVRLKSIAQEVADYVPPPPRPKPSNRAERAALFAAIRQKIVPKETT